MDLGYRYAATGRLRSGLELLAPGAAEDPIATALAELLGQRLEGRTAPDDDALAFLTLAVHGSHAALASWALAPNTPITIASARVAG